MSTLFWSDDSNLLTFFSFLSSFFSSFLSFFPFSFFCLSFYFIHTRTTYVTTTSFFEGSKKVGFLPIDNSTLFWNLSLGWQVSHLISNQNEKFALNYSQVRAFKFVLTFVELLRFYIVWSGKILWLIPSAHFERDVIYAESHMQYAKF